MSPTDFHRVSLLPNHYPKALVERTAAIQAQKDKHKAERQLDLARANASAGTGKGSGSEGGNRAASPLLSDSMDRYGSASPPPALSLDAGEVSCHTEVDI